MAIYHSGQDMISLGTGTINKTLTVSDDLDLETKIAEDICLVLIC